MKAVLVTLSGDPELAGDMLQKRYPGAEVERMPRTLLETGDMVGRIRALFRHGPDIFAVMTESLTWQYGRDALMLFGALGGARESVILDARGAVRSGTRVELLLKSPFRIARNFVRGVLGVRRAHKMLDRLERKIKDVKGFSGGSMAQTNAPSIVYMRATPSAGTQPGGATSHINGVVNALIGLGARITFIGNDEIAGLDTSKLKFRMIGTQPDVMPRSAFDIYNGMRFSAAAAELTAAARPDFVYQRYSRFSTAGVEASLRAKVPLFLEYNGSEVWVGKHWDKTEKLDLLARYERLNLAAAARVFVISEVERNNLLKAGLPGDKIVVNPNGVDTDEFRPGAGGQKAREDLGFPADVMLVGFVGTFGPWHGVLELADAIALMPKESCIRFLLVGDGSLRAEVENKLREARVLDRVIFAGTVNHGRVPALLDACDILVSPHVPLADNSEFFGSPTKLFEYMAMGKGIVASRLGQIGDVLVDNETALLVEPGNASELSDAIQKLANDRGLLGRLGENARTAAIAKHTWNQNARRVLETFRQMAS